MNEIKGTISGLPRFSAARRSTKSAFVTNDVPRLRDRNLRAAIAWGEMALRAVQTESARDSRERVAEAARDARAAAGMAYLA